MATTHKTSDFYRVCRYGDMDAVQRMLPRLKMDDINRVESNGSTALHASSYYGHAKIVRLLLERGVDATIRNKYGKTAKEEASTEEVRALFEPTKKVEQTNNEIPRSEFFELYRSEDGTHKTALATRILKTRLSTYNSHKLTTSNLEHLEKKYGKACAETKQTGLLQSGLQHLERYRATGDFSYMIRFYIAGSPSYEMIRDDEIFLVEMYKYLLRYDGHLFQGHCYRGYSLRPEDLEVYRWTHAHPRSLLEMRKTMSTSTNGNAAVSLIRGHPNKPCRVLFEMGFIEPCFTTIDVRPFRMYAAQEEVLILPGTFFEVTRIREDSAGLIIVSLKNVPVDKHALSAII